DTINRHGHISFSDISYLWARSPLNKLGENYLPERTFHNHRQAILDTFGIEIKCDRSLGYYIANSEDLEDDGIRQWMLNSLSLSNMMNECRDLRDRILF
ncbi:MAG: WYL domain-containing protein, partial [Bacteroidales bacterium]|nr:WYL domain-containing protein [Bacteroidales bacterium]